MELSKLRLKLDSVKNEVISAPPCNDAIHNGQGKLVFCDLLLGDIAYLPAFGFLSILTAVPFPFTPSLLFLLECFLMAFDFLQCTRWPLIF